MKEACIQVVLRENAKSGAVSNMLGLFIEQLRYAGILSSQQHWDKDTSVTTVTIYAPADVNAKAWADMNVKSMHSFGLEAIVV